MTSTEWAVEFTPNAEGSELPFFCVSSVSGDASGYGALARQLGARFPFIGIQTPFSKRRGNYIGSIESIAQRYVEATDWPEGPFVLGGWSAGGTIALEMAQRLRAHGRHDFLLIAIDAPLANISGEEIGPFKYAWELSRNLPFAIIHHEIWQQGGPLEIIRAFGRRLKIKITANAEAGGMDLSAYSPEAEAYVKDLYRLLARGYTPKPYDGSIVFCIATVGPVTHLPRRRQAWESIAAHGKYIPLKGTHVSVVVQDFAKLAEVLRREITGFGISVRPVSPGRETCDLDTPLDALPGRVD
jgi:thioesterase domain-containing protein